MSPQILLLAVLLLSALTGARAAHADDLTDQLKKGPLVRVEVTDQGRFKRSTVLIDVAVPMEKVWATLADFKSYPTFMPRCEEVEVRKKGKYTLIEFDLDTPLVSTNYTSRYAVFAKRHRMEMKVVDGDIEGSTFVWQLAKVPGGTRVTYSGVVRNFSIVAESLDDDQQSITIGINVVSLLQGAKALKFEAERRYPPKKLARPASP